jgi:hypothetical protein
MIMKVDLSAKLWEITTRWDLRTVHESGAGRVSWTVRVQYKADHFRVATALFLQPKNTVSPLST